MKKEGVFQNQLGTELLKANSFGHENQSLGRHVQEQESEIVNIDPLDLQLEQASLEIAEARRRNSEGRRQVDFPGMGANQGYGNNNQRQASPVLAILDIIYFIYIVYLFFSTGITSTAFVVIWLITNCFIAFQIKIWINLGMLLWAIIVKFFYEPSPQVNFYFYLHIIDVIILALVLCCCQIGLLMVFFLQIKALFLRIKVKLQKHQRYKENKAKIDNICASKYTSSIIQGQILECTICLNSQGQFCETQCKHKYHPKCLQTWLKTNISCPLCRRKLY